MHPNEMVMIFRAPSNQLLPTMELRRVKHWAEQLSPAHEDAVEVQWRRQFEEFRKWDDRFALYRREGNADGTWGPKSDAA